MVTGFNICIDVELPIITEMSPEAPDNIKAEGIDGAALDRDAFSFQV